MNKNQAIKYVELDWLKTYCIIGILIMHCALSFTYVPDLYNFWLFSVKSPSVVLTGFCSFMNSTCMPIFFLLSGLQSNKYFYSGDAFAYLKRIKKWLIIFVFAWLPVQWILYAIVSDSIGQITLFNWLFPNFRFAWFFGVNLIHFWYLILLIFFELSVFIFLKTKLFPVAIRSKRYVYFGIVLTLLVHSILVFAEGDGYIITPITIESKTVFSVLVYFVWYLLGVSIREPMHWIQDLNRIFRKYFGLILGCLLGYFYFKYLYLIHLKKLDTVVLYLDSLFDALVVWVVLFIWAFIMDKYLQKGVFLNAGLLKIRDQTIRHSLLIYLLQIPLIFAVLAIAKDWFFNLKINANDKVSVLWLEEINTWMGFFAVLVFVVVSNVIILGLLNRIYRFLGIRKADKNGVVG